MPDSIINEAASEQIIRNATRADVSINQTPDNGVVYDQVVKGPAKNNMVGQKEASQE